MKSSPFMRDIIGVARCLWAIRGARGSGVETISWYKLKARGDAMVLDYQSGGFEVFLPTAAAGLQDRANAVPAMQVAPDLLRNLKQAEKTISSMLSQIDLVRGDFDDEDGIIANAIAEAESYLDQCQAVIAVAEGRL